MRTYTTTVREGEKTGAIDWNYNFRQHFNNYCTSDAGRDEICAKSVQRFREIAEAFAAGKTVRATTYGGWPRFGYGEVLDVGMYDGWPYWEPVPSVFTRSALGGGEWHCFAMLTDYEPANVRGEAGPTVGRQARAGENVPRTARPGLVARRWASPRPRG